MNRKNHELDEMLAKLGTGARMGAGVQFGDALDIDESKMSAGIIFADGNRRDGVGDLLEVTGIDLSRHRRLPNVLFDHGKSCEIPIAMACERDEKGRYDYDKYTVVIDPVSQTARMNAFFYQGSKNLESFEREKLDQHALFCEQLYHMVAMKMLGAGSIGYQVIRAQAIAPDYQTGTPQGLHLQKVLMLEGSLVVMPANQDTVRKALCLSKVCGKPLSPVLVKSLSPYAGPRKAQMGYEGKAKGDRIDVHDDRIVIRDQEGPRYVTRRASDPEPMDLAQHIVRDQMADDSYAHGQREGEALYVPRATPGRPQDAIGKDGAPAIIDNRTQKDMDPNVVPDTASSGPADFEQKAVVTESQPLHPLDEVNARRGGVGGIVRPGANAVMLRTQGTWDPSIDHHIVSEDVAQAVYEDSGAVGPEQHYINDGDSQGAKPGVIEDLRAQKLDLNPKMPKIPGIHEDAKSIPAIRRARLKELRAGRVKSPTSPLSGTKIPPPKARPGWVDQKGGGDPGESSSASQGRPHNPLYVQEISQTPEGDYAHTEHDTRGQGTSYVMQTSGDVGAVRDVAERESQGNERRARHMAGHGYEPISHVIDRTKAIKSLRLHYRAKAADLNDPTRFAQPVVAGRPACSKGVDDFELEFDPNQEPHPGEEDLEAWNDRDQAEWDVEDRNPNRFDEPVVAESPRPSDSEVERRVWGAQQDTINLRRNQGVVKTLDDSLKALGVKAAYDTSGGVNVAPNAPGPGALEVIDIDALLDEVGANEVVGQVDDKAAPMTEDERVFDSNIIDLDTPDDLRKFNPTWEYEVPDDPEIIIFPPPVEADYAVEMEQKAVRKPQVGDRVHVDGEGVNRRIKPNMGLGVIRDPNSVEFLPGEDQSAVDLPEEGPTNWNYVPDNDLKDEAGQSYGEQKAVLPPAKPSQRPKNRSGDRKLAGDRLGHLDRVQARREAAAPQPGPGQGGDSPAPQKNIKAIRELYRRK